MKKLTFATSVLLVTLGISASAQVTANNHARGLTEVYRVGIGDVLDVQLPANPTDRSTLFTVLEGGFLDYPLTSAPVKVEGLTPSEIAARLRRQIKVIKSPAVIVKVRDYASHNVAILGLVGVPGSKTLRREAVPLKVVLAEARPLPEAARVTIIRLAAQSISVDLSDAKGMSTYVVSGDTIRVSAITAGLTRVSLLEGEINSPLRKSQQ